MNTLERRVQKLEQASSEGRPPEVWRGPGRDGEADDWESADGRRMTKEEFDRYRRQAERQKRLLIVTYKGETNEHQA